jgi:small subunit ribosomal protein S17
MSETQQASQGKRKVRVGVVVSDKMDKTIVVAIQNRFRHPLYGKIISNTTRFKAHDEENACGIGDTVRIVETRPLSHDKHWRVLQIVSKAK